MQYTNLGNSGLQISRIGLGMMSYGSKKWRDWVLDEEEAKAHIQKALELGINFFDTANMYSLGESEIITGKWLKEFAQRDKVVIATKVHFDMFDGPNGRGLSRKHIFDQVEQSLKRLQTDYIDLYQIHRWDYNTPIEETLEALNDLVRSGKVRYIGASSMFAYQFSKTLFLSEIKGWTKFISMQNHYNLVYREEEREMNPLCISENIGLIPWSPLARGFLTASLQKKSSRSGSDDIRQKFYNQPNDLKIVETVLNLALEKNVSPAQVALAWLLQRPNVAAPIIGTTKLSHLEDAIKAVDLSLSQEEILLLEKPYLPRPILGHF